jgi:ATP-binding cassette subfamily B protein
MKNDKKTKRSFKNTLNIMIADCKPSYYLYFVLTVFSVFFAIFATYSTKVLYDILQEEIVATSDMSQFDILLQGFVFLFGGPKFLAENKWIFAFIILGFAILSGITIVIRRYLQANFQSKMGKNMEDVLFYHIERLPFSTIKGMRNGDIIQTCTTDERNVRKFLSNNMSLFFYTGTMFVAVFTILMITSWKIAVTAIALMPFMFIYSFFVIQKVTKLYRIADDSEGQMTSKIEENLSSVRLVKAFNNESYEIDDFENYIIDYRKKYTRRGRMSSFFYSSSDIFVFGQIALCTILGFYLAYTGQITIGTFAISFTFVNMLVWPVRDVATVLANMAKATASLERIRIILDTPMEDIYHGKTPKIEGGIEFKDVSFHFPDSNIATLKDVSFKIKPKQTVAIMGKTGSGKSTLMYLLTGLYDYNAGHILIDGHELRDIEKYHLRKNVNIVLQDPFLFSKTIKQNLKIARDNAQDQEIIEASKVAHIYDSIMNFKLGYETPVGEKGTTLSGGQKQRVAIARTLLTKAPIIIFDDSFSAIDSETDYDIRRSLKARQSEATTIIITHRISTAKDSDLIVVLDDGKVAEMGKHEELIKHDGIYKRINDIQSKME